MNENRIIAAILTIATSARESRGSSAEVGKENWRKAIKDQQADSFGTRPRFSQEGNLTRRK